MRYIVNPPATVSVPVLGSGRPLSRCTASTASGRNYEEHAKEMGFTGREPPFFFLKPADAVVVVNAGETGSMPYPSLTQNLHHEIELVVAIGTGGTQHQAAPTRYQHIYRLRRRPGHDAPRPAERNEEAGPALVHRQGV
jgi:fumarylpyruvate hydrolase